ncbi:MAG: fumarylacetoacetate hydrolase [Chloroflexi bacterium]|nr:fumarylacetoacetate hydrolase [Chloroflexota bacterium]
MYLTRHHTPQGARWALDGALLRTMPHNREFGLDFLMDLRQSTISEILGALPKGESIGESLPLLPPLEPLQEVWASGVTYLRSRVAREAESEARDVYAKVYAAVRPELFLKSIGWRVVGHTMPIRIRADSRWNVPEPELVLVINRHKEIIGYCAGNDVSSRDIEGANPLYLPQAKIYNQSCALGPGILLAGADELRDLPIEVEILRPSVAPYPERLTPASVFHGETRVSQMKRSLEELVDYLCKELDFPQGVFLMTGTGIVPPESFSMQSGDTVKITVGALTIENSVAER